MHRYPRTPSVGVRSLQLEGVEPLGPVPRGRRQQRAYGMFCMFRILFVCLFGATRPSPTRTKRGKGKGKGIGG